jgi:hypothetical protein
MMNRQAWGVATASTEAEQQQQQQQHMRNCWAWARIPSGGRHEVVYVMVAYVITAQECSTVA